MLLFNTSFPVLFCYPPHRAEPRPVPLQVGGEVARRAKGLGMNVISYDPYASEERAAAGAVKYQITFAISQFQFGSLNSNS